MKPIQVTRRPKVCPKCGGEILDIIYGMPTATWEEDYFKKTGHHASLGGCCIAEDMPNYVCKDCEKEFVKLHFPRNAKQLAKAALLEYDSQTFCDVKYIGIDKKRLLYRAVVSPDYICDGYVAIYVSQVGQTKLAVGYKVIELIDKIKNRTKR